jgi:ABC-type sugar transport system ATPase subunit
MSEPVIPAASAAGIRKQFGSTHALRGVELNLYPGRCLAWSAATGHSPRWCPS